MIDFAAVAPEVFSIIRSRDYVVDLYDEMGDRVIEPRDARRFYIKDLNHLVALVDSNENSSIKVRLSRSADISDLLGFINSLRAAANKYNMLFDVKRGDREYQPKDFSTEFSIVRESADPDTITIYDKGEVANIPYAPLAVAALDKHSNNGGSFYDVVGQQIIRMADDYRNLSQCSQFIDMSVRGNREIKEAVERGMRRIERSLGRFVHNPVSESISRDLSKRKRAEALQESHNISEALALSISRYIGEQHMQDKVVVRFDAKSQGHEVNANAWNDLQNGILELISPPQADGLGRFERFEVVVPMIRDDSLMALMQAVAEAYPHTDKTSKARRNLERIISAVLKATQLEEAVILRGPLREFQEWFNSKMLAEDIKPIKTVYGNDSDADNEEETEEETEMLNEGFIQHLTAGETEWNYLGLGTNEAGVQGHYYRFVSDPVVTVFVHSDARIADVETASAGNVSFRQIEFLNDTDLAEKIDEVISPVAELEVPFDDVAIAVSDIDPDATLDIDPFSVNDEADFGDDDFPADDFDTTDFDTTDFGDDFDAPLDFSIDDFEDDIEESLFDDNETLIELGDEDILTREDILLPDNQNVALKSEIAADVDDEEMQSIIAASNIKKAPLGIINQGIPTASANVGPV